MRRQRSVTRALLTAVAGAALALTAGTDAAIVRTTAFGSGADTYADEASPTTARGTTASIQAKRDTGNRRIAYVRFDVSNLGPSITVNDIVSATISLTNSGTNAIDAYNRSFDLWGLVDVSSSVGGNADRAVTGSTSTGGWIESGTGALTWNNAPGRGGGAIRTDATLGAVGDPSAVGVLLGTFTPNLVASSGNVVANQTFTFGTANSPNVSTGGGLPSNLVDFLKADTNGFVTFAFTYSTNGSPVASFHSKENTAGTGDVNNPLFNPTLTMVIPEPASLSLLALGGLTLLRRHRA